jgi:hypothetical protein
MERLLASGTQDDPQEAVQFQDLLDVIRRRLRPLEFEVFRLRYIEGSSWEDAAGLHGKTANHWSATIPRKVRRILSEEGWI